MALDKIDRQETTEHETTESEATANGQAAFDDDIPSSRPAPAPVRRNTGAAAEASPLAHWAGALLVAAAFFAVAAVMAFGSVGRQSPFGWAFVVLGLLALGGWLAGRSHGAALGHDKYARQRTLLGTNALTSVLLFAVLLVGVNYIATRRHKTFDLTSNRVNSLADQTYKALDQLPGTLTMTYVYVRNQPDPAATALLNSYKNASDKVKVEYLNAALDRLRFSALNLTTFTGAQPTLLLQLDNSAKTLAKGDAKTDPKKTPNRQEVTAIDEQNVTSALLKLVNPQPKVVYFLTGHGEADPATPGERAGLNDAKAALEAQNYTLKTVSLTKVKAEVPAEAAALVVAGPQVDLAPQEEKILTQYATVGKGRLALLLGPTRGPLPGWYRVVKSLGLDASQGLVIDREQAYFNPQFVMGLLGDSGRHPLLRGVSANVVFPGVLEMRKVDKPAGGLTVTPLFESSSGSEGYSLQQGQRPKPVHGPFVLAAAVERTPPGGAAPAAGGMRAVVVANANFAEDQFIGQFDNKGFLTAAVNWTVGNDALVSIPPKPPVTNSVSMPDTVRRFVMLFSLFALPLTVLIAGTAVWWKRR